MTEKIWSRANLAKMPAPYNENLALYNWPGTEAFVSTSDPDWYHHSGNGYAQGGMIRKISITGRLPMIARI